VVRRAQYSKPRPLADGKSSPRHIKPVVSD
jgi:hypothetical protein